MGMNRLEMEANRWWTDILLELEVIHCEMIRACRAAIRARCPTIHVCRAGVPKLPFYARVLIGVALGQTFSLEQICDGI